MVQSRKQSDLFSESLRGSDVRSHRPPESDVGEVFWREFLGASSNDEFYGCWLAQVCRVLDSVTDAVLIVAREEDDSSSPSGREQVMVFEPRAAWPSGQRDRRHLAAIAERALKQRETVVAEHGEEAALRSRGNSETPRFSLAQPIFAGRRSGSNGDGEGGPIFGVLAVDVDVESAEALSDVRSEVRWAASWLELRQLRAREVGGGPRLAQVARLVGTMLRHPRFRASATAFVTELATLFQCDRVSLGFRRRKLFGEIIEVRAMSHSAVFGKKTNLVRAIESAMAESVDQQNLIVYPKSPDGRFQLLRAHDALSREYGAGSILTVPLCASRGRHALSGGETSECVAAITLERPESKPFQPVEIELCESIAAVAGPILELTRRDDRAVPAKGMDSLRCLGSKLVGPRHVILKLVAILLVAATVFFTFAKGDFRVAAESVIEGEVQRVVAAPFDGFVAEAPLRAGDRVARGQLVCMLDDRDLALEKARLESRRDQIAKQHRQARAGRESAQTKILASQLEQVRAQLSLIEEQLGRVRIESQIEGVIVSGDLTEAIGAPVRKGDALFEIAPLSQYRVVLQVDERDIHRIAKEQSGELVMTAFPDDPLKFHVSRITPVSTAEEGRNFFRVEAELVDVPDSLRLRPGMEGLGKVMISREPLIWIWTHRAIEWMKLFFWEWTP